MPAKAQLEPFRKKDGESHYALDGEKKWAKMRTSQNPQTNNLLWLVTIKPGEEVDIPLRYEVQYPKDKQIEIS